MRRWVEIICKAYSWSPRSRKRSWGTRQLKLLSITYMSPESWPARPIIAQNRLLGHPAARWLPQSKPNRSWVLPRFCAFGLSRSRPRSQRTSLHSHSIGGEFHGYNATGKAREVFLEPSCASGMRHDTPEAKEHPSIYSAPFCI